MNLTQLPPGGGKTQHAIEWLLEDPVDRAIVVPTARGATQVLDRALRLDVSRYWRADLLERHILPYRVMERRRIPGDSVRLFVDDLDRILEDLFGSDVAYASARARRLVGGMP